jgi:hypothetical protein
MLLFRRSLPACFFFLLAFTNAESQNLTGIWRGYFISDGGEQYKFELQLDQHGNNISGVSYSYLTTVFYGKATLTGSFNVTSQHALVQEIKTVEVKMGPGSVACIMKCNLQFARSGREEFLEGMFTSQYENNSYGAKKGDNCGSGKVYLRKVPTSDFYVEPFLRQKSQQDNLVKNKDSQLKSNPPVVKKNITTHKPISSTPGKTPPPPVKKSTVVKKPGATIKQNTVQKRDTDAIQKIEEPGIAKIEPPKISTIKKEEVPTPYVIRSRENNLVQTLTVTVPTVTVRIYDNGEIDDDSISVYLDKKLVLSHKRLSTAPLTVTIHLDETDAVHELVMVADNLGRIPPNTSLMIVDAGDKRYEVRITSTEQKNAVVRFVYQKPE